MVDLNGVTRILFTQIFIVVLSLKKQQKPGSHLLKKTSNELYEALQTQCIAHCMAV